MSEPTVLVGDIGGTNARFALARVDNGPSIHDARSYAVRDFAAPEDAIEAYLAAVDAPAPARICLAAAGPQVDGEVRFTNSPWVVSVNSLRTRFADAAVHVLNDFEAVASALPHLGESDIVSIGTLERPRLEGDFTVAVLGPGTGLGVAALISRGGRKTALVTEGGHTGFAAESARQTEVLRALQSRYSRVSDERLISGQGIENIFWALDGADSSRERRSAAAIFDEAAQQPGSVAAEAVHLFFEILGQIAGNAALVLGAFDGVFLTGGVAQRHGQRLIESDFRRGFEYKGRMSGLMQRIPTVLVVHPHPGLLGASAVAFSAEASR